MMRAGGLAVDTRSAGRSTYIRTFEALWGFRGSLWRGVGLGKAGGRCVVMAAMQSTFPTCSTRVQLSARLTRLILPFTISQPHPCLFGHFGHEYFNLNLYLLNLFFSLICLKIMNIHYDYTRGLEVTRPFFLMRKRRTRDVLVSLSDNAMLVWSCMYTFGTRWALPEECISFSASSICKAKWNHESVSLQDT
jgi:hypothetical protein